ncbi:MAG: hypothetical protein EBW14_16740 [Oxalobacteraceae bacterium]|nr:hypothetical protein [Oxalobacteraceae bacterium]
MSSGRSCMSPSMSPSGTTKLALAYTLREVRMMIHPLRTRFRSVVISTVATVALGVVLAAAGYPDTVRKGDEIRGLDAAAKLPGKVFHAGTTQHHDHIVTHGGRVLCAVGLGDSVSAAQNAAYALVDRIDFAGMQCRRDIGYRAIHREQRR